VVCGVRKPQQACKQGPARCRYIEADFSRDREPEIWLPRLDGVDTVINAAGIIRQTKTQSFEAVHCQGPKALFLACERAGVSRIIQISALGASSGAASAFHRSKHVADAFLLGLRVSGVVVQPSLVYGNEGESSRTFRALASLPIIPLPGSGRQMIQPVHVHDVAEAIVALVRSNLRGTIPLVGPRPLALRTYLEELRNAMRIGKAHFVSIPIPLLGYLSRLGGRRLGWPDADMLRMLERGNTAEPGPLHRLLARAPRPVYMFIPAYAAQAVRLAARMSWLAFLLRISIASIWIATGLLSLGIYPVQDSYLLLERAGIPASLAPFMLYGGASIDLIFGIGALLPGRARKLWLGQAAVIFVYSVIVAFTLPEFWLHPFGPLLKNLSLLAATAIMYEVDKR
jgi:uncharacterized protein YbjT (DUF2867 family)